MKPRLNIVTIGVSDLPTSRQFYMEAFGWKPAHGSGDQIVFFNHGGIVLGLYPLNLLAEDAGVPVERSGFSGITLAINTNTREEGGNLPKGTGCRCKIVDRTARYLLGWIRLLFFRSRWPSVGNSLGTFLGV